MSESSQFKRKEEQELRAKQKRTRIRAAIIFVLAVIIITGSFVVNSDYFYTGTAAVSVGDVEYSAAELSYFYQNEYSSFTNSLGDMASLVIDSSKPLDEQYYTEDQTFHDYFISLAETDLANVTAACRAAEAEGMTLSEDSVASVDQEISNVETYAMLYGTTADILLQDTYGKGFTAEIYRHMLEMQALANQYTTAKAESFEYTEEELKANYAENKDDYDIFGYYVYYIENGDDAEAAYALADEIALAEDGEEFAQLVYDNAPEDSKSNYEDPESTLYYSMGSTLSSYDYGDWLKESGRSANDTTVIESSSGGGYYVLMFVSRDDNNYQSVSMRHILVKVEADEDGNYTTEAINTARAAIDEIAAEFNSGDKTEDSFAALANEKSEDEGSNTNGGLYEHVYHNQMVEPINDYIFDSARKAGDTEIIYYEGSNYAGYHLVYFVGEDGLYCDYIADTNLRNADFSSWLTAESAKYPITEHYSIRFVG